MSARPGPWFDADLFEQRRIERKVTWGRPVRVIESTPSTNDLGLDAVASPAKTGIVWVAREQIAGRGRRGARWHAAPGEALLTSTLLRWPAPTERLHALALAVGLAVREVVASRIPGAALLKWPNDVLVRDRKISGVLVESKPDGPGIALVLGVGINVRSTTFPEEAGSPTSLTLEGAVAEALGLESLLVDLLGALERRVPRLLVGNVSAIVDEARECDALRGRVISVTHEGAGASERALVGRGAGITDEGHLLVDSERGRVEVGAGHVSLLE